MQIVSVRKPGCPSWRTSEIPRVWSLSYNIHPTARCGLTCRISAVHTYLNVFFQLNSFAPCRRGPWGNIYNDSWDPKSHMAIVRCTGCVHKETAILVFYSNCSRLFVMLVRCCCHACVSLWFCSFVNFLCCGAWQTYVPTTFTVQEQCVLRRGGGGLYEKYFVLKSCL
jgi:hypothetical protein